MSAKLTKECECGSNDFYVNEGISHKADIHEGKLIVYKRDWATEVQGIACIKCGKDYTMDDFDTSELF